jgi:hypothetical protein
MEHGTTIDCGTLCDSNKMRYVGWEGNEQIDKYFSLDTRKTISRKVTELTMGVDPNNKPIVVPDSTICNVLSQIYDAFRPATGDIYSRYIVPAGTGCASYTEDMIQQTIEILVEDIRTNIGMEENNKKLTVWTSVYGDFNAHGLRQHPPIKTLHKRPNPMEFHMRY